MLSDVQMLKIANLHIPKFGWYNVRKTLKKHLKVKPVFVNY